MTTDNMESQKRATIIKFIKDTTSSVIPLSTIREETGSSYPFIKEVAESLGYKVEKRTILMERMILAIIKDDNITFGMRL